LSYTNREHLSRPLLIPAVSLACGIAAGKSFEYLPYTVSALSIASLFIFFLFLGRKRMRIIILSALFFFLGSASFYLYGPGAPSVSAGLVGNGPVRLTATVVRPPEESDGFTRLVVEPVGAAPFPGRKGLILLSIKGAGFGIRYGDVLCGTVALEKPRGFRNFGEFDRGRYDEDECRDAEGYVNPGDISIISRGSGILSRLYALRLRLSRLAISSLPPEQAALFNAMVLGDQNAAADGMRDVFSASGATHLLVVSGSHIALLASLVFGLVIAFSYILPYRLALRFSLVMDRNKAAALAAIPAATAYALLAGMHVSTVRSLLMIMVFLISVLIDREKDSLNVLAGAAMLVLILDPSSLFDISFQLSYCAVLFMALAVNKIKHSARVTDYGLHSGLKGRLFLAVAILLAVTAGTAPLVAKDFNSLSWVSIPANMALTPVSGFILAPVGLLSALLYVLHPAAVLPLKGLISFLFGVFYKMVEFFAAAPHANLHPPAPTLPLLLLIYAVFLLFLIRKKSPENMAKPPAGPNTGITPGIYGRVRNAIRTRKTVFAAGVAAFLALGLSPASTPHEKKMEVAFLDVGHGDSCLLSLPDGKNILVDGGGKDFDTGDQPASGGGGGLDPGRAAVAPYLWNRGIRRLDAVLLTHPHPDHMNGLVYIFRNFDVGELWESGLASRSHSYRELHKLAMEKGVRRIIFRGRGSFDIDNVQFQVLNDAACPIADDGKPVYWLENDRSVVLRVKYGKVSFLLGADIQMEAEEALLNARPPL
ncbi:MAG: ComEC/Rec2 family competence protein, partial [Nitrospirota bacterium]